MRDEIKEKRQARIEQAAYDLLEQQGYDGISMLKIAKRAKSSNETLYRWYGDKKGLFRTLVENNAQHVTAFLQTNVDESCSALETLDQLGPRLLELLMGERAVALNRAAAGDPTGELGAALAESGRSAVVPLIARVFERLGAEVGNQSKDSSNLTEIYLRLLIGDLQIRRATGAIAKLPEAEIFKRSQEAKILILQLGRDA